MALNFGIFEGNLSRLPPLAQRDKPGTRTL